MTKSAATTTRRWTRATGAWAAAFAVVAGGVPVAHASSAAGTPPPSAEAVHATGAARTTDDASRDRRSTRDPWVLTARRVPVVKTGDPKLPFWIDERRTMPMTLSLGGRSVQETLSLSLTHSDRGKAFSGHVDSRRPGGVPMWLEQTAPTVTNVTDVETFSLAGIERIPAENVLGEKRQAVYAKGSLTVRETFVNIDSRSESWRTAHSLDIAVGTDIPLEKKPDGTPDKGTDEAETAAVRTLRLQGGYTGTWERTETQTSMHNANLNAETTLEIEWLIVPSAGSQSWGDLYMKIL